MLQDTGNLSRKFRVTVRGCIGALICFWILSSSVFPQETAPKGKKPAPAAPVKVEQPVQQPESPADRVAGTLKEFIVQADLRNQGKQPAEKMVRLSEGDLNDYLQQAIKKKMRYGITSVHVKLIGPDYVGITTTIDFDKVTVEDEGLAVRMARSLLSGQKQIYVEGMVTGKDGQGQFRLDKAYLDSVRLPVYFIDKVINFLGHRQNPPLDTSKPAPLPYGLRKVEITAGSIALHG